MRRSTPIRPRTLALLTVVATLTTLAAVAVPAAAARGFHARPVCPSALAGSARCSSRVVTNAKGTPLATTSPMGYGPTQFHGAYALPTVAGSNQTIAIVDAYDDPTAKSDLDTYDATFGLPFFPSCSAAITTSCFQKVNQSGNASPLPRSNAGWALEISLDVQIAHAICQNCKILLVEAKSNSFTNLAAGVNTAAALGANVISNSYGGSELSSTLNDSYNHPGIAITVSSGDAGYRVESPASLNTVVAVGGTTLTLGANDTYAGETVWSGAGSGCSAFFAAQAWQTGTANWSSTGCGSMRGVADVAADADPATGASVYDSTRYQGQKGWFQVGGTSLSSPLIAAVYALAGNAGSTTYPASLPYANPAGLHDVTEGSNGGCGTIMCEGTSGYDGPTGVGTPNGIGAF
jgi:subtilase family serine protease